MKHAAVVAALALFALSACDKPADKAPEIKTSAQASAPVASASPSSTQGATMAIAPSLTVPAGHPGMSAMGMGGDVPAAGHRPLKMERAQVVSHIDIPQFTYLEVKQDDKTLWLASKAIAVKDGDTIKFAVDSTMDNFTSATLKRTFESLTFVSDAAVVGGK